MEEEEIRPVQTVSTAAAPAIPAVAARRVRRVPARASQSSAPAPIQHAYSTRPATTARTQTIPQPKTAVLTIGGNGRGPPVPKTASARTPDPPAPMFSSDSHSPSRNPAASAAPTRQSAARDVPRARAAKAARQIPRPTTPATRVATPSAAVHIWPSTLQ